MTTDKFCALIWVDWNAILKQEHREKRVKYAPDGFMISCQKTEATYHSPQQSMHNIIILLLV